MICDQKVKTVVMLTKLMEGNKPKCEQYWPNKVGESTNPKPSLTVTFVQMQKFADYELRMLQVKSVRMLFIIQGLHKYIFRVLTPIVFHSR